MTLEQQVTSLKISKKLKELGVKQESLHWWGGIDRMMVWCNHIKLDLPSQDNRFTWYSAFTVAELGELLPDNLYDKKEDQWFCLTIHKISDQEDKYEGWEILYKHATNSLVFLREQEITEADARGKMLIYLLENKLIKK